MIIFMIILFENLQNIYGEAGGGGLPIILSLYLRFITPQQGQLREKTDYTIS